MPLIPETVVERGELWTVGVNRNQNLLGKSLIVLNRPEVSVVGLTVQEWLDLHRQMVVWPHRPASSRLRERRMTSASGCCRDV
jgi:hypothetical protein